MADLTFLLDANLGLKADETPVAEILRQLGIAVENTTDLPDLDRRAARHGPDLVYIPIADFHRLTAGGDHHYRGLAIATSKFTGTTRLPSVLVVRKGDGARTIVDLEGARCGYINRSCSSSWFPPAILLGQIGREPGFLDMVTTKPWQGQIDAVVSGEVRATMVPEDVWRTEPANADATAVIGRYDAATPALIVARHDLDAGVRAALLDALVRWVPAWTAVYGPFRPFLQADVHAFFHDLDGLPPGL